MKIYAHYNKVVVALLMLFSNAGASANADTNREDQPFVVYGSKASQPTYARDQEWKDYYEHGALDAPFVQDDDIEAYDWDNQAIVLTDRASKRLGKEPAQFIVALGDTRLYGGTFLNRISQMAVEHPVIYKQRCENRVVLLIRPTHDFGAMPDLSKKDEWQEIASKSVEDHFKSAGKLRHSFSDKSFEKLSDGLHIEKLVAQADSSGLNVTYDLNGSRNGDYTCSEQISWKVGNESKLSGPIVDSTFSAAGKPLERKVKFMYADLQQRYQKDTMLKEDASLPQQWQITVEIAPKLSDDEKNSLDLVDKINLELLNSYGGEVFAMMERQGRKFSSIRQRKVIEVPIDWAAVNAPAPEIPHN